MDRDDRLKFWLTIISVALVLGIWIVFAAVKYNCCMEAVGDHDECVYDVACNSG